MGIGQSGGRCNNTNRCNRGVPTKTLVVVFTCGKRLSRDIEEGKEDDDEIELAG